jgi:U3 small nucleolar RNA-associated protein 19
MDTPSLCANLTQLFEAEMNKEVKKAPVVEFHIPKRVFLPQDAENGVSDSLLVKLWGF